MKHPAFFLALLTLSLPIHAETVDLGPRGKFSITPPKDWTCSVTKEQDNGCAIMLTPPESVNARCLINIVFVPKEEPMTKDDVRDKVLLIADQFVEASVEKKKDLRDFALTTGYGYYCLFTDASLVGKPPEKEKYKIVAVGMIHFSDDLAAAVSFLADDPGSPEFAAMMKAVTTSGLSGR
jgi:hypothetical protein